MAYIWDETYLNQLLDDAEEYITASVNCIYDRFALAVTSGQSVYTLPTYVKNIVSVTWKGKKVYPLTFIDFCALNPANAIVNETTKVEAPSSIPHYYVKHPTNYYDIRFWPTPSENISAGTTNLFGSAINSNVIFSVYRTQSTTQSYLYLPLFLKRRIKKAYILSKAFAKEGKGQDIEASQYYTKKLEYLIEALKEINSNVYLGKQHLLNDTFNVNKYGTPARPVLPPEYGVIG